MRKLAKGADHSAMLCYERRLGDRLRKSGATDGETGPASGALQPSPGESIGLLCDLSTSTVLLRSVLDRFSVCQRKPRYLPNSDCPSDS